MRPSCSPRLMRSFRGSSSSPRRAFCSRPFFTGYCTVFTSRSGICDEGSPASGSRDRRRFGCPGQVIFPNRREHFNRHGVFEDVRAVFDPSGNAPTVANRRLVFVGANRNPDSAPDQVPCLLVRMRMSWQDRAFAQQKLRHQGSIAMNQSLPFNPVQGRTVVTVASFLEHS